MRVALFTAVYNFTHPRNGVERCLISLIDFLRRKGIHFRIYSPAQSQNEFFQLISVPIPGWPDILYPIGWNSLLQDDLTKFDPSLLHIINPDIV